MIMRLVLTYLRRQQQRYQMIDKGSTIQGQTEAKIVSKENI